MFFAIPHDLTVPAHGRYRKVPKGQEEALCVGRCRNPKQRGISMHTDDASRQGHLLVTNHHFLEKAVANAFELVWLLFGPVCAGRVAPTLPGARPGCSGEIGPSATTVKAACPVGGANFHPETRDSTQTGWRAGPCQLVLPPLADN